MAQQKSLTMPERIANFIENTRQVIRPYASVAYTPGIQSRFDIANVGLLASVWIEFEGTMTCSHPTKTFFTKDPKAPYNLYEWVELRANNGTSLWFTSGYGAYLQNITNKLDYKGDRAAASSLGIVSDQVFQFDTAVSAAGTANTVRFCIKLNVAINDRDPIGLFPLQNSQTRLSLFLNSVNPAALMTDTDITATLTGVFRISTETFSVPTQDWMMPPLNLAHIVREQSSALSATGKNSQDMPIGTKFRRLINYVEMGGALSDAVDRLQLDLNLTDTQYDIPGTLAKIIQRERYGRDLPTGTYVWDFVYQGFPNVMNLRRDIIQTSEFATMTQNLYIPQSAPLGANNNRVSTVIDQLMEVDVRVTG